MSNTNEDDAARDRRVYLDEMSRMQSDIAALHAENRRYRDEIAARPAPPEIWWPLPKACVIDGDRTERQRATDHENMRRQCDNKSIIARKEGAGRGLWWVRMEANLDGRMVPMRRR
jgi:hypothetical protein